MEKTIYVHLVFQLKTKRIGLNRKVVFGHRVKPRLLDGKIGAKSKNIETVRKPTLLSLYLEMIPELLLFTVWQI